MLAKDVALDISQVRQRAEEFRVAAESGLLRRTGVAARAAGTGAAHVAVRAATGAKSSATSAKSRVTEAFAGSRRGKDREPDGPKVPAATLCTRCGAEVTAAFNYCPACGQPAAADRDCASCGVKIAVAFGFCPHSGSPQE